MSLGVRGSTREAEGSIQMMDGITRIALKCPSWYRSDIDDVLKSTHEHTGVVKDNQDMIKLEFTSRP